MINLIAWLKWTFITAFVFLILRTLIEWGYNDHGDGDQLPVFAVIALSFVSPLFSPIFHLKMVFLQDILPFEVEKWIVDAVGFALLTPAGSFEDYPVERVTDYSDSKMWSMLPGRGDTSDIIAPGAKSCDEAKLCNYADVFYLHPTTWYSSSSWNSPALHSVTAYLSDEAIGPQQANAFNIVGRVFAPRYRQCSAGAFLQQEQFQHKDSKKALEETFKDVSAAFEYYLSNHWDGVRGIILAGHSQGSMLNEMILRKYFHGKQLHAFLVAAYLPGWSIFKSSFPSVPKYNIVPCENATSIGCLISWRTFGYNGDPKAFLYVQPTLPDEETVCTNPLSWDNNGGYKSHSVNLGGVDLMHPLTMLKYLVGNKDPATRVVIPESSKNVSDAECVNGNLFITPPPRFGAGWSIMPAWHFALFPGLNFHSYDINLFYHNIRDNVANRVISFRNIKKYD